MAEESRSPDPEPVEGAASCVRCRNRLAAGVIACPSCAPEGGGGAADIPEWMRARAEVGDPAADQLVNSPFVVALALGIMVTFLYYYTPGGRKPRAEPAQKKSQRIMGNDLEEMKAWGDQMRQDAIDRFGTEAPDGMTADGVRALIESQLRAIDSDPNYSREERAEIRRIIYSALRDGGTPKKKDRPKR